MNFYDCKELEKNLNKTIWCVDCSPQQKLQCKVQEHIKKFLDMLEMDMRINGRD